MKQTIKNIAVIGAGTMGRSIAYASRLAGYATKLYDVEDKILNAAIENIQSSFRKAVEKGILSPALINQALAHLETTTDLNIAASEADFIIEAVPEKIDLKIDLFRRLDAIAPKHAIFCD